MIAKVIVDLALDQAFDYTIPPELETAVRAGSRVRVPFGRTFRSGYVLRLAETGDFAGELKAIAGLDDNQTQLPEALLKLGAWIAEYYCCAQEHAIRTLLPAAVRHGKIKAKQKNYYACADRDQAQAFILANQERAPAQGRVRILKTLLLVESLSKEALLAEAEASDSNLATLLKAGLVSETAQVIRRNPFAVATVTPTLPLAPTVEQKQALATFEEMLSGADKRHVMLLFGVTGSGKTEVYLQAIAQVIAQGKTAIVLVPEISLTPQTVQRFRARFGDEVSVLHSRLSDGERFDEWNRISAGEVKIAVGARSALFAPFRNVGLIIVDEEHEGSYKQSETPRYHARDVAVMRGHFEKAIVMLGSATPSLESYYNAQQGKYVLCKLLNRAENQAMPHVKIVDLRLDAAENKEKKVSSFSKILVDEVYARLNAGEQVILFLNRRGYARQMMCECCGYVAGCPDCSVPYTYHKQQGLLTCHLCGGMIAAPDRCPSCKDENIRYSGLGTERIEAQAHVVFPGARIERMDSDSIRAGNTHEKILNRFRRAEIDILIGTQMIAKGLHFPNVTLVGVINADMGLFIPDFRSGERTFQLLTQVAGRAGRGDQPGEVIVQTFSPFHEVIQYAAAQNFPGFYDYEIEMRQMLKYPPFGHLIALHFQSEELEAVESYARKCFEWLKPFCHGEIEISEPAPSPIERIKAKFRFQILYRGDNLKLLRQAVRELVVRNRPPAGVEVYADVDAQSMM